MVNHAESASDYWRLSSDEVLKKLESSAKGLSQEEVIEKQKKFGLNIIHQRKINALNILFRQFTGNPLIIILAVATLVSYFLGQHVSSYYIFSMILLSVGLGFWNEFSAIRVVDNLLKKISPTTIVMRNGEKKDIPVSHLTIGDIVYLSTGTIIPADLRLIETKHLEVNQSALTGEAKTIFKTHEILQNEPENEINTDNLVFMGTNVESGEGKGAVIRIGKSTEFGRIAQTTSFIRPMTDFQKGLSKFGNLIIRVILIMAVTIFAVNWFLGHSVLESFLFSLAIAVGLTPELLPVIVTVSLAHGAGKLAKEHIVVKQLISIENLGNMDVLCTDKTGTLTEGKIDVIDYVNAEGKKDNHILELELICNSAVVHHKIVGNAIDTSLWEFALKNKIKPEESVKKIDQEEFDYNKKAMFAAVEDGHSTTFVVKGAPDNILSMCGNIVNKQKLLEQIKKLNSEGLRLVAVATKKILKKDEYDWDDAKDLHFEGYVTFLDVPKKTAKDAIEKLHSLHVRTKIITGDNETITQKICRDVGIEDKKMLTGTELDHMTDEELMKRVNDIDVFARVNPEQKLKIIEALQKNGHTVGYMGDGINDLPPLHSADVGISVNTAVDVAKDAAAVVLLRKSLDVIADGITEGRRTFSNTIKYILMATSSNFGNMFSAAGASFFLTYLPMTPLQILLTNGLYDVSQLTIPTDNVDHESLLKPRHWDINFIKNYMVFFGPLSSIFDYATFGIMIFFFHARGAMFQTGWFIESVATEILVVFVIRTARVPFFKSKPSNWLIFTSLTLTFIGILLPFTPIADNFGFIKLPMAYLCVLIFLVISYLFAVEIIKDKFLKKYTV